MRKVLVVLLASVLAVSLLISACAPAPAPTPKKPVFPEKTITWIVPYSPGGGFDTYSRGISKVMPEYLPKKVDIVVKNMPGGGGRRGAYALYRAKPDGYTMGILNIPGMIVSQIVMETKYDLTEMEYLGRAAKVNYCISVAKDSPFQSLEDLQQAEKKVRFASTGPGGTGTLMTIMTINMADIPGKLITGYKGSTEAIVGVIRGDADAVVTGGITTHLSYIEEGDLRPIAVIKSKRSEFLPDVVTVEELGYPKLAKMGMHRLIAAPPETPKERVAVLEEALMNSLKDKELKEWSKKVKRPLHPVSGEEAKEIILAQAEAFAKYKEMLKEFYKP